MSDPKERFKRLPIGQSVDARLDRLIQDCRDLQEQVQTLTKRVEELEKKEN